MPSETDPKVAAPAPARRVISNDPSLTNMKLPGGPDVGTTSLGTEDFAGERVDLPSRGVLYPKTNPAAAGFVMVRPMTTKEEEILITERFHRQGTAIDMILSRCILTPKINTLDLLSGDRLFILFYLRAISYGPEYSFKVRMKGGDGGSHEQEVKTDVSKLDVITLPEGFVDPWVYQYNGTTYELRLSRGKDEQEGVIERMRQKKRNPNGADSSPTDALKRQIVSVNGDSDPAVISNHVDRMIAKHAYSLRQEIAAKIPGPKLKILVMNTETEEEEEITIGITESFFRP